MKLAIRYFSLVLLTIIISACHQKKSGEEYRMVFKYNESAGINTLDPAFAKDQAHIWVCNQLYNGLVQFDDSLRVKPCIARSWSLSEDGTTYTFLLRKDVFFQNHPVFPDGKGRKVVASDVVYSFNRLLDEKTASPGIWIFNDVAKDANGRCEFQALDDTTVVIKLKHSFPPFLGLLAMQYCSVVPKEIVDHYGKDFRKNAVGTGPFMLKYWKEGQKLILIKNPTYFEYENNQRLPYLDAVSVSFVVDKQSVFLEFVRGNLDLLSGIAPTYIDELIQKDGSLNPKYESKLNLSVQPYLNTEYFGFLVDDKVNNTKNNPLLDKRVRQAINYGIDRKKMIRYLRNNIGIAGTKGIVPLGIPGYDSSSVSGYNYNPEKALQLLADAGYPDGKGLPEIALSTTSSYLDLCEYIQHQLTGIGIKIKVDVNPPGTLREMIAKSQVSFFRASWIADYPDMENYLSLFYSKNFCPQGPNYTHFSNPDFDKLFEKSRAATSDSLRLQYYHEMDNLIMQEAPVLILYYDMVLRFTHKNVSGLGSNALNLLTLKRVVKK
jgi:peptide/nickel transport system substrate-binding protein